METFYTRSITQHFFSVLYKEKVLTHIYMYPMMLTSVFDCRIHKSLEHHSPVYVSCTVIIIISSRTSLGVFTCTFIKLKHGWRIFIRTHSLRAHFTCQSWLSPLILDCPTYKGLDLHSGENKVKGLFCNGSESKSCLYLSVMVACAHKCQSSASAGVCGLWMVVLCVPSKVYTIWHIVYENTYMHTLAKSSSSTFHSCVWLICPIDFLSECVKPSCKVWHGKWLALFSKEGEPLSI